MDPIVITAWASCVALTALVEAHPRVRLPLGLLLALVLLAADLSLLPVVVLGAIGATIGRGALAIEARRGRDRHRSDAARQRVEALQARLAGSTAFSRVVFTTAALPLVPASFLFPLLGAMRVPLTAALAGSVFGLVPMLALTTSLFRWLGESMAGGGDDPAQLLAVFAVVLLTVRTLGLIDWEHRRATGGWRLREPGMTGSLFVGGSTPGAQRTPDSVHGEGSDLLEGEIVDVEVVAGGDDDAESPEAGANGQPPGGLPSGGG